MFMNIASPCNQFSLDLSSSLTDFLLEVGDE
jgi:hypothetical protein